MSPSRNSPTPSERRRPRSRLVRALRFGARITGWFGLLLGITVVAIDRGGWARWQVELELQRRLGELGAEVSFDRLEFDWLGPGIEVEGFRVTEGERVLLLAEHLYLAAGLAPTDGVFLSRLDLDGGRVLICDPLIDDLRALFELDEEREEETQEARVRQLRIPSIQVRDFLVEFEDPGQRRHSLGRVDFSMEGQSDRPAAITGRLSLHHRDGAPATPELFLSGLVSPDGLLELHSTARELDLASWDVPELLPLEALRATRPTGKLSLHTSGSLNLRGETRARGRIRCALRDGSLAPPLGDTLVEGLTADFDANYLAGAEASFWDPEAWSGSGVLGASWAGQTLRGGLRLGQAARAGSLFEGWINAPAFQVDIPEVQAMTEPWLLRNILDALDPRGVVEAGIGVLCREGWTPGSELESELEFSVRVASRAPLPAAWHGWDLPERPGWVPISFPLPTTGGEGLVIVASNARFPRRELVDVDFAVEHPTGTAHVRYQEWTNPIDMPPFATGYGRRETDLFIEIPGIDLDERVREHIGGLGQIEPLRHLYEDGFGLGGGRAAVSVRVTDRAGIPGSPVRVVVGLSDVTARWVELPVPVRELEGEVEVIDDGRGDTSVRFQVEGGAEGCGDLAAAGRVRTTPVEEDEQGEEPAASRVELELIRLTAEAIDFEGAAVRTIAETIPDVADALAELAPRGRADLELDLSIRDGREEERIWVELTPEEGTALDPKAFPMHSTEVRGRVIVDLERHVLESEGEAPRPIESGVTRVAPIVGRWREEIPVAFHATFPSSGDSVGRVAGSGLRPGDEALVNELVAALGADPARVQEISDELIIEGAMDFESVLTIPEGSEEAESRHRLCLRKNDLRHVDGFHLDGLTGVVEIAEDEVRIRELGARLDGTPVKLKNIVASVDGETVRLDADLEVEELTLDRGLLARFLDAESVSALVDEFGWRGQIEVDSGHLTLTRRPDRPLEVSLRGEGTLSDAYVEFGFPLSIGSARVIVEELVFDGDTVRGWGQMHDLYGRVLDRDLGQANTLISYYGSRITMESLDGSFCKGTVQGLSQREARAPSWSGPVFSVDLAPPFEFQANVALEGIDVARLLEGVFASELADRGFLSGEMRLQGELQDLMSVRGSGRGDIRDTVLWSVPVLRDLFSQLGFDATAVFDSMHTDFRVEEGKIYMEGIEVHSPLLRLRGRGVLGLDGTLAHDLEVKYSLVDKIGPLRSLVYFLQNTLLSVSIRGDMSRPKVFLGGALTGAFTGVDEDWRALPLPALSPVPDRF